MVQVISRTILERHNGQSIEFNGRSITINSTTAKDFCGFEPSTLVQLFIALSDATYDDPPHLPFPSAGLLERRNILFSIDDCHTFSERFDGRNKTDALYVLLRDVAASYHDSMGRVGVTPFWFAVGSHLRGRFFDIESSQFRFDIGIPSLGNLLEIKYLAQICKQFIGHKLPSTYVADTSDLPELPESLAKTLVCNYLKTFGNPRAVECFVHRLVAQCKGISLSNTTRWNKGMKLFGEQINEQLSSLFPENIRGTDESVAKLNVAAALCSEMQYEQPMMGVDDEPKALVTTGHLSVWKRERNDPLHGFSKFFLTRPFFSLPAAFLEKQILPSNASDTEHWRAFNISLASLVLDTDCADYLNMKGECFEVAVASTLYARYTLKEKDVSLSDIFPAEAMPKSIRDALITLNGVVILKRSINEKSFEVLEAIMQHQVIAVDIGNSEFAHVLLPITLPGNVPSMVCFRCSNFPKPPLKNLVQSCKKILESGFIFVGIAPVHHKNEKLLAQLSDTQRNRAFLAKASELISPLYLLGMNFVPHKAVKETKKQK